MEKSAYMRVCAVYAFSYAVSEWVNAMYWITMQT